MKLTNGLGILIALAVLTTPLAASAQTITVSPSEYDFGDVVVGESTTNVFDITNHSSSTLRVAIVILSSDGTQYVEYTGPDFSITDAPAFPVDIPGNSSIDVEVTFSPTAAEFYTVWLYVYAPSGDPPQILVDLTGQGVDDSPPVALLMEQLIDDFDAAVADGTVVGWGPGSPRSYDNRLRAFGNMLDAASDLIAGGYDELACDTLHSAYLKSDGLNPPPDFITGDGVAAINASIVEVMDALGCP